MMKNVPIIKIVKATESIPSEVCFKEEIFCEKEGKIINLEECDKCQSYIRRDKIGMRDFVKCKYEAQC